MKKQDFKMLNMKKSIFLLLATLWMGFSNINEIATPLTTPITSTLQATYIESPNHSDRIHKITKQAVDKPSMLILHYSAVPKQEAIDIFMNPKRQVSYHYLIDTDGGTTQFVPENKRAWHAGAANWKGDQDINSISIGVSLENLGFKWKKEHPTNGIVIPGSNEQWYPFDDKAIDVLIPALKQLIETYKILPSMIVGHCDILPEFKQDPGPLFPWEKLYQNGIGMWYDLDKPLKNVEIPTNNDVNSIKLWASKLLNNIGYNVPLLLDDQHDQKLTNVIKSFQMHFRPTKIDGQLDDETIKIIASIADQYGVF
jgi:N-acetylmuramoyl-L-alanine amidase